MFRGAASLSKKALQSLHPQAHSECAAASRSLFKRGPNEVGLV